MGQGGHRGRMRRRKMGSSSKKRKDKDQKAPSALHKGSGLPPPRAPQSGVPMAESLGERLLLLLQGPYAAAQCLQPKALPPKPFCFKC